MSEIKIEVVDIAGADPRVVQLCLQGWNNLFTRGLTDGRLVFHDGMSAIIGFAQNGKDELPAGVLLFGIEREFKRTWITLAYVNDEFRGRGIYRTMYGGLRTISASAGVRSIEYATHLRNDRMRNVSKRMGCAEEFVILVDRIEG